MHVTPSLAKLKFIQIPYLIETRDLDEEQKLKDNSLSSLNIKHNIVSFLQCISCYTPNTQLPLFRQSLLVWTLLLIPYNVREVSESC